MDEPFGAVDTKTRTELQDLLRDLCSHGERRRTVVFITHDVDEALYLADRIIFMQPRRIRKDIRTGFGEDRLRDELTKSTPYIKLRSELISLFYEKVSNEIAEEGAYI